MAPGVQLAVDLDAQRLEGALGGVSPTALGSTRHDPPEQLDQASGGGERLASPLGDDGSDDGARVAFLTELAQDPLQIGRLVGVEHLGGGRPTGLVHPHVQRGIDPIGEPALGLVELQRTHPEVKQCGVHRRDAQGVDDLGELVVDRVDQGDPVGIRSQPLSGEGQCLVVAVDPDQTGSGKAASTPSAWPPMPRVPST